MSNGNRKKKNKKTKTNHKKPNTQSIVFTSEEVISMMDETSQLLAQENFTRLASMGPSAVESGTLGKHKETTDEYNKYLSRYSTSTSDNQSTEKPHVKKITSLNRKIGGKR